MAKLLRKVAIFDIDGTIFRSSLLIELTEALIQDGVMPETVRRHYSKAGAKWLDREGSYEKYIEAVVTAFVGGIKGLRSEPFMLVAKRVVKASRKHVYRYTRDLISDLRRRGYYLLAVSNSPKIILDPFCKEWGFDKVYGRIYEIGPGGRFTGKVSFFDLITDKAKVLARAMEKEHLTLKGSIGVGDTESDIQFLKMVENPICFNPNRKLLDAAKKRGWKVVVERKDVVYKL